MIFIKEYNPNKKRNILFVFDMIANMVSNKKLEHFLFLSHNLILLYQKILG